MEETLLLTDARPVWALDEDAALFKVFYVDGDYEDYEEHELQVAMDCYKNYSSQG